MAESLADIEGRLIGRQDEYGREILDPTPTHLNAGLRRPELTLAERVARLVRQGVSQMAQDEGLETFEEAEDFDVDDDFDPRTPYEEVFDPVLGRSVTPREMQDRGEYYREKYLATERNRYREWDLQQRLRGVPARSEEAGPSSEQPETPAKAGS